MESSSGVFALITEANIERRQSASSLFNKGAVFSVVPDENDVLLTGDWHMPWRVVIIGHLADIVQSTLVCEFICFRGLLFYDYSLNRLKAWGRYWMMSLAMRLSSPKSWAARSPARPCR